MPLRGPLDGTTEQTHSDAGDQVCDRHRDQDELAGCKDRRQQGEGGAGAAEGEQQADVLERVAGGAESSEEDDDSPDRGETSPTALSDEVKNRRQGEGEEGPVSEHEAEVDP